MIVTKKVKYEKELGYRHFHHPNGARMNTRRYPVLEDDEYCPYVIDDNKVYNMKHELFVYGGQLI